MEVKKTIIPNIEVGVAQNLPYSHSLADENAYRAFKKFISRVGAVEAERELDKLNNEPYLAKAKSQEK